MGTPSSCSSLRVLSKVSLLNVSMPGRDQDDGLAPFDILHAVGRVGDGVVQVRFGKRRDAEPLHGFLRLTLVGGEVGENLGPHIVRHHRHIVVLLQRFQKAVGRGAESDTRPRSSSAGTCC